VQLCWVLQRSKSKGRGFVLFSTSGSVN
jgi:hypothetical protein